MKQVYDIRATRTFTGHGGYGYDAEAAVRLEDQSEVYVHVNEYDGMSHFTVGKTSIYDEMTSNGGDLTEEDAQEVLDFVEKLNSGEVKPDEIKQDQRFIEEYNKLSETKASEYYAVFKVLKRCIETLESQLL